MIHNLLLSLTPARYKASRWGGLGARKQEKERAVVPRPKGDPGSNPTSAVYQLCNFGQVASPLWSQSRHL